MGIYELLVGTDEMKRKIQKREPAESLRKQAMADGMTALLQDGIQSPHRHHRLQAGAGGLHQVAGPASSYRAVVESNARAPSGTRTSS